MSESARNIPYLIMRCPVCAGMRGWFDRFNPSYYTECWLCKGYGQLRIYYTLSSFGLSGVEYLTQFEEKNDE